ncbi:DUF2637 domain-containing protein [Mycobacteroides abscessus]|uniref:DUF2637 domain-containing protein n=1 Tax=Mycobacteroides abscessus TaxID=36809 RepID=UPI0013F60CB8|nr:DUF2637 domain-containing protein [Mycobacteroides abscessus]
MSKLLAMVGIGHDAPPARSWTLLLVASVAVSVYGNTAHALLTGRGWAAAAWFAVAPVALFWVTHLVAKTAGRSPHGAVKWLIWFGGIPAALTVAGMAFVVSFRALRDWTLHQGGDELSSILLPLIVDVIIALSSTMVLAMRPATVDRPAELPIQEPVSANQLSTPRPVTTTPVTEQLTAPDVQPPTAADEVITTPIPTAQRGGEQESVTSDNSADAHPAEPAAHQDAQVIPMVSKVVQQEMVTGEQVVGDEQLPTAQPEPAAVVSTAQLRTAVASDEQSAGEQQIDPAQEAAVLRERGNSRLAEDDLTDLIARIARGESYSAIAEATGISRNTVRKVAGQVPTEPEPVPVA